MPIYFTVSTPVSAVKDVVRTLGVTLTAAGEAYSAVTIDVDITTKPAGSSVALMATDTAGDTYDIAAIGHWGPSGGFSVPDGYNATTNVSGIFTKDGDYVITLTLNAIDSSHNPIAPVIQTISVHVDPNNVSEKILVRRGPRANVMTATNVAAYEILYAYDTKELFIANGSGTPEKVSDLYISDTAPDGASNRLWLDTVNHKFKIWNGSTWVIATTTAISDVTGLQTALDSKANTIDVYTKTQVDTMLAGKANTTDVYTKAEVYNKTEVNGLLAGKANTSDVYNKTQVDTMLAGKANTSDVYNKTQVDTMLSNKANKTDVYTKAEVNAMLAVIDGGTF